jgi:DNA polymerase elongation subunit (family B)
MISLNLSPETKIGRVEKTGKGNINIYHVSGKCFELTPKAFNDFIETEKCAVTKAGFLFSQKKKGIIPEFLDHYYNERVVVKAELFARKQEEREIEKELEDINRQLQSLK